MVSQFAGIAYWFDVQVVDQAGLADESSEEHVAGAGDAGDRLKGVGVDDFRVVNGREGLGLQHATDYRLQMQGVAHAGGQLGAGGFERAMQNGGGAALFGTEVSVARRQRQSVRLADDGADDDFGLEVQVARQLRNDADLLRVLAAEIGKVRLNDLEQFHDDGGDAAKMAGTRTSFEAITQALDVHVGAEAWGINFRGLGQEESVDTGG